VPVTLLDAVLAFFVPWRAVAVVRPLGAPRSGRVWRPFCSVCARLVRGGGLARMGSVAIAGLVLRVGVVEEVGLSAR